MGSQQDLAAELLDAHAGELDEEEFDRRRKLIDAARAPRVPYLERQRLVDEAVEGLGSV